MLKNPNPQKHAGMSLYASSADYWKAQAEANAKDAERYRWMRDESTSTWLRFQDQWQMTAAQCDAMIDREMAAHAKAVGSA